MIRKTRSHLSVLFAVALLILSYGQAWSEAPSGDEMESGTYRINAVQWEKAVDGFLLRVKGDSSPTYTMFELVEPLRIVLDIADGQLVDQTILPLFPADGPVSSVKSEVFDGQEPVVNRLEILLVSDVSYSVEREENDIVVRFAESPSVAQNRSAADEALIASLSSQGQNEADTSAEEQPEKVSGTSYKDDFGFSGYEKERISVDFFKIDLHNVFRLIGEVSGLNIVVDEAVKGSLTLALDDVPWDFALDVVINLKDLQKMERFNTILILPKDKVIDWPEQTVGRLAIKAEESLAVEEKEGLSVQERLAISPEETEAKMIIRLANNKLAAKQYEEALSLLEKAFAMWPESGQLANKISSLCLVHLGLNAKAIYYSKQALRINPHDSDAALQAAIGNANMQNSDEAVRYFSEATRGERPSASALLSYAAFVEQTGDFDGALALLDIHAEVHGGTVETMVSKARLYDKKGDGVKAAAQYRAIMLSGYSVPPDLKRFIEGRVSMSN